MSISITEHELCRACEVIFGPELSVTREFLEYLQPSGIKTAYRKRAMETHPDRFIAADEILQRRNSELFLAVQSAYENLLSFLRAREQGFQLPLPTASHKSPPRPTPAKPPTPNRPRSRQRPKADFAGRPTNRHGAWRNGSQARRSDETSNSASFWNAEQLYSGPLPSRRLLVGHFLYYSGITTWRTIVQALIWQRMQRPRLGEIGQRFGLLKEDEVLHILRHKDFLQPFGASAVEQGFLTKAQLNILVHHQKRLQRKFGEYFVEHNLLRPAQLEQLLRRCQAHNARLAEELAGCRARF